MEGRREWKGGGNWEVEGRRGQKGGGGRREERVEESLFISF